MVCPYLMQSIGSLKIETLWFHQTFYLLLPRTATIRLSLKSTNSQILLTLVTRALKQDKKKLFWMRFTNVIVLTYILWNEVVYSARNFAFISSLVFLILYANFNVQISWKVVLKKHRFSFLASNALIIVWSLYRIWSVFKSRRNTDKVSVPLNIPTPETIVDLRQWRHCILS